MEPGGCGGFCCPFCAGWQLSQHRRHAEYGRAPFQAQHQRIFSTIYKGSHNSLTLGRVHFIRPDVAVADVDGVLSGIASAPPDTPLFPDGSIHVKLQLVLSRQNGAWQIDSFHNVTVNPHVGAAAVAK